MKMQVLNTYPNVVLKAFWSQKNKMGMSNLTIDNWIKKVAPNTMKDYLSLMKLCKIPMRYRFSKGCSGTLFWVDISKENWYGELCKDLDVESIETLSGLCINGMNRYQIQQEPEFFIVKKNSGECKSSSLDKCVICPQKYNIMTLYTIHGWVQKLIAVYCVNMAKFLTDVDKNSKMRYFSEVGVFKHYVMSCLESSIIDTDINIRGFNVTSDKVLKKMSEYCTEVGLVKKGIDSVTFKNYLVNLIGKELMKPSYKWIKKISSDYITHMMGVMKLTNKITVSKKIVYNYYYSSLCKFCSKRKFITYGGIMSMFDMSKTDRIGLAKKIYTTYKTGISAFEKEFNKDSDTYRPLSVFDGIEFNDDKNDEKVHVTNVILEGSRSNNSMKSEYNRRFNRLNKRGKLTMDIIKRNEKPGSVVAYILSKNMKYNPKYHIFRRKKRGCCHKARLDRILKDKDMTIISRLLKHSGLMETVKNAKGITILLPVNSAFSRWSKEIFEKLEMSSNLKDLRTILKFHVLLGVYSLDGLLKDMKRHSIKPHTYKYVTLSEDKKLSVSVVKDKRRIVFQESSEFVRPDYKVKQGYVHKISKVLVPENGDSGKNKNFKHFSIWLRKQRDLRSAIELLNQTKIYEALEKAVKSGKKLTLFLPVDFAFKRMGRLTMNREDLMKQHVALGIHNNLKGAKMFNTINDKILEVKELSMGDEILISKSPVLRYGIYRSPRIFVYKISKVISEKLRSSGRRMDPSMKQTSEFDLFSKWISGQDRFSGLLNLLGNNDLLLALKEKSKSNKLTLFIPSDSALNKFNGRSKDMKKILLNHVFEELYGTDRLIDISDSKDPFIKSLAGEEVDVFFDNMSKSILMNESTIVKPFIYKGKSIWVHEVDPVIESFDIMDSGSRITHTINGNTVEINDEELGMGQKINVVEHIDEKHPGSVFLIEI